MSTGIQQQCIMHPTIFQNLYGMKWYETHHQNPSPASSRFGTKNWYKSFMLVEKRSRGSPHFMQFHLVCFTLYVISIFFLSYTLETTYTILLRSSKTSPLKHSLWLKLIWQVFLVFSIYYSTRIYSISSVW